MNIKGTEIAVDIENMKAEIDTMDNGKIYVVQDGKVTMLPLPQYGVLEIPCQNYKVGKPKYHISVDI